MSMNEADTRYHLIDPVLRNKGCVSRDRITLETVLTSPSVEPIGPKGRRRKGRGRSDYLLCVQVGDMPKSLPVAVLEAKKESEDPLKGMQQAKGYADCRRFEVKYVFATNGHRYGEFDFFTRFQNGPFPFADFPSHPDLTARYANDTGIDITRPEAAILFQTDSPAWPQFRYYQDAAIRAAFEKIIRCSQNNEPARVLLALATGSGKTIIATNLLWRLGQAEQLPKPVLFLCDRDELREQAYTKLRAAFGDNARIHIATYQTLGLDDEDQGFASFLTEHYSENAFSVIIIDECHRSAWGKWAEVLLRNPNAIHIGLTTTPRQLRESKKATSEDREITANNHKYFGEPVYEYTLIQAQEDGYLAACEIVRRKADIDKRTFTKAEILAAGVKDIRTGKPLTEEDLSKEEYTGKDFDDALFIELRTPKMCEDLFALLCQNGGPEQKVIIFCTREIHADRVAMKMNNLYVDWCGKNNRTPKDHYAFKCMGGSNNGADMIEPIRGSSERAFIACTVDLLEAGVDIERLNAVVFFRYLQSPIKFESPSVAEIGGHWVRVTPKGRFILTSRDGRDTPIPVDEYRREVIQRVLREAHDLDQFRALWIETQKRRGLINHLLSDNFSPEVIREIDQMTDFDLYDFFGHHGYHARALRRTERGDLYVSGNRDWFGGMDQNAATVLKGFGRQLSQGGTDALETTALWEVPEIRMAGGLAALRELGKPAEVMIEAKERLFGH